MELRSGRSRSSTPFLTNNFDSDVVISGNHVERVSKTRSMTIKTYENIASTDSKHMKLRTTESQEGTYKTSDYSSEDGEHEISLSPVRHISDNLKNQLREEALHSNGKNDVSALKVYKEAGDYWNKFPKTDYTYSKHSRDRVELAPGVVAMPNMSRKALHTYSSSAGGYALHKSTNTESYSEADSSNYITTSTNGSSSRYRHISSNSQNEEDENEEFVIIKRSLHQRTIVQKLFLFFVSIFTTIFHPVYYVYDKQHSVILWFAKKLHQIASRMMLLDTWLLQGTTSDRKIPTIMGLCLFPLLFFGGWWLICGLGHLLQDTFNTTAILPTQTSFGQILSPWITERSKSDLVHNEKKVIDSQDIVISQLNNKIEIIQRELLQSKKNNEGGNNLDVDNVINDLKVKIDLIQKELSQSEQNRKDELAKILAQLEWKRIADKAEIIAEMNQHQRRSLVQVEQYVFKFLKEIFGTPSHIVNQEDFTKWIHLIFIAQQNLEARLANLSQNLKSDFDVILANNEKLLMDKVTAKILELHVELSKSNGGTVSTIKFSDEHVKKLVEEALTIYDADKTGLVDFALESSGGHIISTRCTESYQVKTAVLSIFGLPIYYPTNSPRTAITPGVNPGECWAFQNFPGYLVVKLSARIIVEAFSVEHISKRLSATGKIDSALKKFEVYGLANETDADPVLLGSYEYKEDSKPLQYFEVQKRGQISDMVELRILSNHGNPNYTCLYRFRVHGILLSQEPT